MNDMLALMDAARTMDLATLNSEIDRLANLHSTDRLTRRVLAFLRSCKADAEKEARVDAYTAELIAKFPAGAKVVTYWNGYSGVYAELLDEKPGVSFTVRDLRDGEEHTYTRREGYARITTRHN